MIFRRKSTSSRGQGLTEFALVFPILVLILLGIFDLGRGVFAYNTIGSAAREGARVAAVNQILTSPDCINNRPVVDLADPHWSIKRCAAEKAVGLGLQESAVAVAFAPPPGATFTCSPAIRLGCLATVTVSHTFTLATPIISDLVGPIGLEAVSEMPIERVFP